MSGHTYHDDLPGFDAEHILHDGCEECEGRAADPLHGLLALDPPNLSLLFLRMEARERDERPPGSACDFKLMDAARNVREISRRVEVGI